MTVDAISPITVIWRSGQSRGASSEHSFDCTCSSGKFTQGIGWEQFTDAAIQVLNEQDCPIVFLLWGRPAQMKNPC